MTASLFRLLFFIALGGLFGSRAAVAAEPSARIQGMLINADDMFRDTENETVELQGHVQIVSQQQHIQADRARISLRSRKLELDGHVKVTSAKSTLGGDRVHLDYENNTGVIYNGYVQSGPVIFEGTVLQKTGPDEYFVLEANYTACTNCPASWSFRGSTIRAELGGYAYIKNSVLSVGDLPILWLPYLVVPLKSDRQTGLLTPGLEHSETGGWAFSQPFFWAISRSTDATVTIKNYELRGLKGLVNYRYLLSEDSGGELDLAGIRDRVFQQDKRVVPFRQADRDVPINRWFLRYNHYLELSNGWVHRAQLNNASDLQYASDFSPETNNNGDPAMENRMSFTKNTRDQHLSIDTSYSINLLQGNPLAGNEDAVHRMPEIRFAQVPKPLGHTGLYWSLDINETNFARSGPAYDNLYKEVSADGKVTRYLNNTCNGKVDNEGYRTGPFYGSFPDATCARTDDGIYNPNIDLLRTGQRLNFQPSISRPFTIAKAVDVLPKISYRETHYQFGAGDERSNIRRLLRTEVSGRASFSRIFGDSMNPKGTRYKHDIRPEVTYTALPWIDHKSHPFFGFSPQSEAPNFEGNSVSDADLAGDFGLQFDYQDRLYDRNLVTYAVVNTLTEKRWVNDVPSYKQVALLKIAQSFDAYQDRKDDPKKQPWSDISALVDLRFDHFQTNSLFNYFPYQKVTNSSVRFLVNDDFGRFIQLGMNYQYRIVPGQEVVYGDRVEDYSFAAGLVSRYINFMGRVTYDAKITNRDQAIKSWAYIVQLKPPGDCWIINFTTYQPTGGTPNFAMTFDFTFDGVPKPPLPASTLDQYSF